MSAATVSMSLVSPRRLNSVNKPCSPRSFAAADKLKQLVLQQSPQSQSQVSELPVRDSGSRGNRRRGEATSGQTMEIEKGNRKDSSAITSGIASTPMKLKNMIGDEIAAATAASRGKRCHNKFCVNESTATNSSRKVASEFSSLRLKSTKLKSSGEKVTFCEACYSRYSHSHFCQVCEQIYFDEYNIDEQEWIQCDSCDLWTHLGCEEEKIKRSFSNASTENLKYECLRCRRAKDIVISGTGSVSLSNQSQTTQASVKSRRENNTREGKNEKVQAKRKQQLQQAQSLQQQQQLQTSSQLQQPQQQLLRVEKGGEVACRSSASVSASNLAEVNLSVKKRSNSASASVSVSASSGDCSVAGQTDNQHNSEKHHNLQQQNPFAYSLENFLRKKLCKDSEKGHTFSDAVIIKKIESHFNQPSQWYLDDLLKGSGKSTMLEDSLVMADLVKLRDLTRDFARAESTITQLNLEIESNTTK